MRITFYVGVEYDKNHKPIPDTIWRREQAVMYLSQRFGGATTIHGHGGWIDGDDKLIREACILFIVELHATAKQSDVKRHAEHLRDLFNQTSVCVSLTESAVHFI